jgi:hypothetical protein
VRILGFHLSRARVFSSNLIVVEVLRVIWFLPDCPT